MKAKVLQIEVSKEGRPCRPKIGKYIPKLFNQPYLFSSVILVNNQAKKPISFPPVCHLPV